MVISDLAEGELKQTLYIEINHAIAAHESLLKSIGVQLRPKVLAEVHKVLAVSSSRQFSRLNHAQLRPASDPERKPWEEDSTIPLAGRVFTED